MISSVWHPKHYIQTWSAKTTEKKSYDNDILTITQMSIAPDFLFRNIQILKQYKNKDQPLEST